MKAPSKPPPVAPQAVLSAGILAMSTAVVFIRYAQEEASSLVIAAYRLSIASAALAPLTLGWYRKELRALRRGELGLGLLSGVFLAVHFATWISSLEYTTVASSLVLVWTSPLWVGLLSPLLLGESVSRWVKVGLAITLTGTVVIGLNDACASPAGLNCPPLAEFFQGEALVGDLLALAGALAGAGYLMMGRNLRAKMSLPAYIFVVYGMAAATLMTLAVGSGEALTGYAPRVYVWFAILGLVPQLFGHSTVNWALRYVPATVVSISLLGEPIGSTILAYLFLNETPTLTKLFGAILVLTGITLASQREANDKPRK